VARLDFEKARRQEVAKGVPVDRSVVAWWWTIAGANGRCARCGNKTPRDTVVAYNHAEQRSVCEVCADRLGLSPQPSKRFLAQGGRKQKAVRARERKAKAAKERKLAPSGDVVRRRQRVRRSAEMQVRYECPICGGPHARADH
jgi:hypothetical protein